MRDQSSDQEEQSGGQEAPDLRAAALTRRGVLRGASAGGLAVPLLVACGSDPADPSGSGSGPDASSGGASGSAGGSTTLPTSEVPVGGGTILAEEMVVVTQPTEGEFQAFSARCTHQGCPVQTVSDGRIGCNCHGSAFSIKDGSVVSGPASSPLGKLSVNVEGDQLIVG